MEKEIIIKIDGKEWTDALDKAFKSENKKAKIDGFRPGKAPKEVFIKKYGMIALYEAAAELCVDSAYEKMLKDNGDLKIVAQPELGINAVTDEYIEFKFVLTLKPEVKLGKYTELGLKKEVVKVTKKEVTETLDGMREKYMENVEKDGKVENGDVAVIDFEGFLNDVAFDGGKGEDYSLKIGSNTFIPGFEEQVIGMKKGETKDINVSFPDDYHAENLKGQPVVFKVTVKEVTAQVLPELDKDFFADLNMEGIETEEALRAQIEENIKVRKEADAENAYLDNLLEKAASNMEVEIPKVMIKEELDRMIGQYEQNLSMQGLTLEQFYQFTNSKEEDLKTQMEPEASKRVKYRILLEEIANAEKIEISDKDASKEAKELASKYEMNEEEFLNMFGGLDMIKYDLKMRQAMEVLKK